MKQNEVQSVIDTIDALGVALSNEGHTWSPELRLAYENAIRLLKRFREETRIMETSKIPVRHA